MRGEWRLLMRVFNIVVERDPSTQLYTGYVPGWPNAYGQGTNLDELHENLREVLQVMLERGVPYLESEFVGVQTLRVA
jgi:predicted RNase H-like HicB family nuclease